MGEEPRKLRGHRATATCCVASRDRPGVVATSGEDGCVCLFDLRCKDVELILEVDQQQAIASVCFKPGFEDVIFVSTGNEVKCFDVRMAAPWKPLKVYNYNKEEINQIVCNSKATFLASTDDGGDVKIIDINQNCLYKTLRAGHTSICSSVQFIPWRPWEVITGGLDCKLVMWDFSKGRAMKIVDFSLPDEGSSNRAQCVNPAFVHALAVADVDMYEKTGKICVVARGDGAIDVINIELELAAIRSKSFSRSRRAFQTSKKDVATNVGHVGENGENRLHLDYSFGGHTAGVSCIAFSLFGEQGKFIISGGNDKFVKVWDCSKYPEVVGTGSKNDVLRLDINLKKKVNWICTTPTDTDNLVVCDTSKFVKLYTLS